MTKKRRTVRKAARKRSASGAKGPGPAGRASRAQLGRELARVLEEHGMKGRLLEMHFQPEEAPTARRTARRRAGATAAAVVTPCPPGTVRRVVCFFRKGTFVCEERCVPV